MSKEGRSGLGQIRSWLATALLVFVALNILLAVVRPVVPYLVAGILLITVARWLYGRSSR